MATRASLVRLLERVASIQKQKQSDFIAQAWDVTRVVGREEKRGGKIIKALRKAEARAAEKEKKPLQKVDRFTKAMHHKRDRQMAKLAINDELRNLVN
ncbi:hypothetical protein HOP50_01g03030 [Chloropicon primus]|uniref:Uncharacterized protein n=1 Tax=Chloropicon primus TaxID=1764295 RepID=A0A5B8MDT1_9CHLO|nr:hypothetical protein A3770_01p03130 [Chloropicon primus]UPQ97012.1 hypothetical protein HOP50_01g03030 [Chloropicon primus]|eukprot:QDZ17795.1 hypothetical protein A3770_01p03130 [Chloropicon primus]